jgi:hypothetical protein
LCEVRVIGTCGIGIYKEGLVSVGVKAEEERYEDAEGEVFNEEKTGKS